MSSLRSILGGSRIKKKKKSSPSNPSASAISSWPRTKSTFSSRTPKSQDTTYYDEPARLPYHGPVAAPTNAPVPTVAQALHHARATMFDPLPTTHSGMSSARIAAVLNYRASLPHAVSVSHVGALLAGTGGPTAVERAVAQAVAAGEVRRIVVLGRGGIGEVLVEAAQLEEMVSRCEGLDEGTKDGFVRFLRENRGAIRVPRVVVAEQRKRGVLVLSAKETDQLIRAGFLTAQHETDAANPFYSRPEDRYSLMSLESVSRAASGTFEAVGGADVVASSGGTGAGRAAAVATGAGVGGQGLSVAVPGNGTFLKLVEAALRHLASLLEKAQFREMPEEVLKERWDGGVASDAAGLAKRARGEFVGILPGRTKKWKDFYGLSFEWILVEAVGMGRVEVFDTRSVGNGVRLIS